MEAVHLELTDGAPSLSVSSSMVRRGLVTTVHSPVGTAAVVGWVGSVSGREAGARRLLDDFSRPGADRSPPTGDYAAVLVYGDRVQLVRDGQARIPLFLRESGGRVTGVSTSARRLGCGARLEPRYMCRYLTGNMAQLHTRLTPFAGVQRVLGGEVVELSVNGRIRSQSLRRHALAGAVSAPGTETRRSAAECLRAALERAVDRRVGGMTACHVSGGTDSTSVALLVARRLAARQDEPGSLVLVAGRFGAGELSQEQPYLDEAVLAIRCYAPSARLLIIETGDIADFDDFEHHAGDPDEPYAHAFRAPFWARLHTAAAELGCETLLTGCGADPIADANLLHLHRLVRQGQLRSMVVQAQAWAEASERTLREIVLRSVVEPSLPLTVERVGRLLRGRGTVLRGLGNFTRPRWLRSDFARAYGYRGAGRAESRFMFGRKPEESCYEAANYIAAPDPLSWFRAERDGFFLSHPFLDPDVIGTMCRLPPEVTFQPGRPKAVLREAMADLLPSRIRDRTVKVPFDELHTRGLQTHGAELIDLCRSASHPLVPEIFDVETLCRALTEAVLGVGNPYAWDRLNASLALVAWLERLGCYSRSVLAPLPVPVVTPA
ncbi:asparagine synthase-related protein [Streptacidiphilus griseoplanus]|uniref:asparagine synthase-related protein n=1 Tax=Peterkaempfera griseoplana TaxID=66896 RepID=UPI0006E2F7A5|nr:asparagine synthase-related protein [Peterkaempfera griseoplana]